MAGPKIPSENVNSKRNAYRGSLGGRLKETDRRVCEFGFEKQLLESESFSED